MESLKSQLNQLKNQLTSLNLESNQDKNTSNKPTIRREPTQHLVSCADEKLEALQKQERITLNVGGKIFHTTTSFLNKFPNTRFSEALQTLQNNFNQENEIFFDRSYKKFKILLAAMKTSEFNIRKLDYNIRDDLKSEVKYFKMEEFIDIPEKNYFHLLWDVPSIKAGQVTQDSSDIYKIDVHSSSCYNTFFTDIKFKDVVFQVEFEFDVHQSLSYLYFGIINESYNSTSNCMCCKPTNCVYVQCNGQVKHNGTAVQNPEFAWNSDKALVGMKVDLLLKKVIFYRPNHPEIGPYDITGSEFRIVSGHCNQGNGSIKILQCCEI